jgi:DNA-binding beta-propeller fold protein YncE
VATTAPEFNHGFISDEKANTVLMFDLKTSTVLSEVASPKDPDGIIYDGATKRVFAFNGDGASATAIDAARGKVAGTVDLGGGPEFAAADGNGSAGQLESGPTSRRSWFRLPGLQSQQRA